MATERNDWTAEENEATVTSYFSMLKKELAGVTFVKSHENELLRTRLNGRTRTAVEYKHQNISAVLLEHGWIYIKGYKPMRNVQNELRYEVERQLRLDTALELATVAAAQVQRQLEVGIPHELALTDPPAVVIGTAEWTPRAVE